MQNTSIISMERDDLYLQITSILLNQQSYMQYVNIRYDLWPQKQVFLPLKHKVFLKSLTLIMRKQMKCKLGIVQEQQTTFFKQKEPYKFYV